MPCSSLIYYNFFNKPLSAGLQLQFVETVRTVTAPVSNRWGNLKIYLYAIVTEGVCNTCQLKLSNFIGCNENDSFAKFYGANILVQLDIASKLLGSHAKFLILKFLQR